MGKKIRHIWAFSLIWLVLLAIALLTMPNEGQLVDFCLYSVIHPNYADA